jgi:4-hydroxy-tetrahydrodipicolinate synthase
VPSRTACGLADETVVRLAEMAQFIGLLEGRCHAAGPACRTEFQAPFRGRRDALQFLAQGGNGRISVTYNILPGLRRSMFLACKRRQSASAKWFDVPIAQLTYALFREPNPVPLKYAEYMIGGMSGPPDGNCRAAG